MPKNLAAYDKDTTDETEANGKVYLVGTLRENAGRLEVKMASGWETYAFLSEASGAPSGAGYITYQTEAGLSAEKVLGTEIVMAGTFAARPAASLNGRLYLATDEDKLYRDTGSAWQNAGHIRLHARSSASDHSGTDPESNISFNTSTGHTHDGTNSKVVAADVQTERVEIAKNSGATVGTRKRVNLIEGANVTLTIADDAGNNEVDVTIASTGGGGGAPADAPYVTLGQNASLTAETSIKEVDAQALPADNVKFGWNDASARVFKIDNAGAGTADLSVVKGNVTLAATKTVDGVDVSDHTHSGAGQGGTVLHASLGTVTPDQHHAQSHVLATNTALGPDQTISGAAAGNVLRASAATLANFQQLVHADLGSVTADQHHAQAHAVTGADHTHSGGTAGRFMRETAATTFAFEGITFTVKGGLKTPTAADDFLIWEAPFACTVIAVRGYQDTGTGSTFNAFRGTLAAPTTFLAANATIASADTMTDGGSVQNASVAIGDKIYARIAAVSGSPNELVIILRITRP